MQPFSWHRCSWGCYALHCIAIHCGRWGHESIHGHNNMSMGGYREQTVGERWPAENGEEALGGQRVVLEAHERTGDGGTALDAEEGTGTEMDDTRTSHDGLQHECPLDVLRVVLPCVVQILIEMRRQVHWKQQETASAVAGWWTRMSKMQVSERKIQRMLPKRRRYERRTNCGECVQ